MISSGKSYSNHVMACENFFNVIFLAGRGKYVFVGNLLANFQILYFSNFTVMTA
jgi:hypothetical protein